MKLSKHSRGPAGQSRSPVRTSQKHDVNLQKNTTIYFQVGLILALMLTWGLFEMQFKVPDLDLPQYVEFEEDDVYALSIKVEEAEPQATKVKTRAKQIITKPPRIVKSVSANLQKNSLATESQSSLSNPGPAVTVKPEIKDAPTIYTTSNVEQVPVYPGCEGLTTNFELMNCMSEKLKKHVQRRFDTGIANAMGLQEKQKIYVFFTINEFGEVTNIKARNPYEALKKEAIKVTEKIPTMEPAMQGGKRVRVTYTLPITVQYSKW